MAAAKTKDSALKERDKVHKAYKAVTAQLLAENRQRLPAAAAFADWLATDPGPDDRHAAVMMMCNVLIEVDGMADPMLDEPPSTFQELRTATLSKRPKQIQNTTATPTPRDTAVITLNIATPDDAARLPALLASLLAQFGASAAGQYHTGGFVTAPPTSIAVPYEHTASCVPVAAEPAVEAPKRTRKAKPDAEVVAKEPIVVAEPEPAEVVEEETGLTPYAEPAPIIEEPAAAQYTLDDVRAALQTLARSPGGVPKLKPLLDPYGATKSLSVLSVADYAAVIHAANAAAVSA